MNKQDLRSGLKNDEASLSKLNADIQKLRAGESVENLRLDVAERIAEALKQCIANKLALLAR